MRAVEPTGLTRLPFTTDAGIAARARIGLVVLASDLTIEHEWRTLVAGVPGVALHHARLFNDARINPETLRAMDERITPAAALLLPGHRFDVVAYGCTSASMVLGEEQVAERLRAAHPQAATTNPVTAARAALRALGASRIALLTPYRTDVNQAMQSWFEARGIEVVAMGSFLEEDDGIVGRITAGSVRDAAVRLGREPGVEAVFVACTSLRVAAVVTEIEAACGRPATSSNHAMAWHALRLAGIADAASCAGRLFRLPLSV